MLSARAIALQGVGSAALLLALQGFVAVAEPPVIGGGGGFRPARTPIALSVRAQHLREDEELLLLISIALQVINSA